LTLYCATTNPGKLREFRLALEDHFDVQPITIAKGEEPEETGDTFEANANLKALWYSERAPGPVFTDDSGLEVDALDGAPGVYSARYAGAAATDDANNRLLLERMRGITPRTARFVCVIALAARGRLIGTFRGAVEGELTEALRGGNGFGYDPLFFYPPFGCTFGEAPLAEKMKVSHRSRALRAMKEWLIENQAALGGRSPG